MHLLQLNKWDLIRAKRAEMSDNLSALKTKIASSKQTIARIVLHRIIKLANTEFKKL